MDISIFDAVGPVMIGPSSSHTAGAAKLARAAVTIIGEPVSHVSFGLYGSFAKTYKGHGTDIALVAGVLGLKEDDERLTEGFSLAKERNLTYEFYETELRDVHENSVLMTFTLMDGRIRKIIGSSIGGGQILIRKIDEFDTEIPFLSSTLIICQEDRVGIINEISRVLVEYGINIGVMTVKRNGKGERAFCIIETDTKISEEVVESLRKISYVISVQAMNPF